MTLRFVHLLMACLSVIGPRFGVACDGTAGDNAENDKALLILSLNLEHSAEAAEELEAIEETSTQIESKSLAALVLKEWHIDRNDQVFSAPRLAWAPDRHYPDDIGQPKSSLTVVIGDIGQDGKAIDGKVLRSSGSEVVDSVCIEAFLGALFRPALLGGHYSTKQGAMTCEVYFH